MFKLHHSKPQDVDSNITNTTPEIQEMSVFQITDTHQGKRSQATLMKNSGKELKTTKQIHF